MANKGRKRLTSKSRFITHAAFALTFSIAISTSSNVESLAASKKKAPPSATKSKVKAKPQATTSNDSIKLIEAGQKAMLDEKLDQAEEKFRLALSAAEKSKNVDQQITSLQLLSQVLESLRKVADAQPLRQKALDLAKKQFGADSAKYAAQLAGMSCYFTAKGDNAQSWSFAEQANETLSKAGGSAAHPLESADCSMAVGRIQALEGSRGLADTSFKKALELQESKLKPNSLLVLITCKEYAKLLEQLERMDEAKALKDRITVAAAVGGGTASDTANAKPSTINKGNDFAKLVAEAKSASDAKDNQTAITKWQAAAQIAEKSGNKEQLAYALVKMGDLNSEKGQEEKRAALYKRSATIREEAKASDTLGMARVLTRLANIEMSKKNYAEAKRLLERALVLEEKHNASSDMKETSLRSMQSVCMMTKDMGKAEEVSKKLVALAEADSSPNAGIKKAMAVSMLAGIYMQSGRLQEGMQMMKSVSGQMTQEAAQEYGKANLETYMAMDKAIDSAEEKKLGIE